jgi:phytanoyl-CoA hydroxylase
LVDWVRYPETIKVARCFAGEDLKSTHHMYINKPPDVGNTGIHPLHQDMAYFPWSNPNNVVACWTAMADVTKENGCLVVLPGSHKAGLRDHSVPKWMVGNAGFHTVADMEWKGDDATKSGLQYAEMKAGDTIFFHPFVVHGSGFNNSKQCRKSMTVHYASARSKYFSVADTPQDYVAKEIMTSLLKVPAKDVDPEQARQLQIANWKFVCIELFATLAFRQQVLLTS